MQEFHLILTVAPFQSDKYVQGCAGLQGIFYSII